MDYGILHKDEFGYAYFQRKTLRYSTEKCGYDINIIKADWEEVVYQLLIRTENYVGVDSLLTSDGEYVPYTEKIYERFPGLLTIN